MLGNNITIGHPLPSVVRGVLIMAAVAAIAAPVVVPTDAAAQSDRQRAKRTNVYVQGDSLTVGSKSAIRRKLRKGVKNVWVDAQVGRHTSYGLARTKQAWAAKNSRVWVMALGTNDAPSASTMKHHVRTSLRAAGKNRDVVWVTIRRPGTYATVNRMLRSYASSHRRLYVVDWARYVRHHRATLGPDRVHATPHGYEVRATMIARKARRLARAG
jgi:lysophospholipase L1-like esterase